MLNYALVFLGGGIGACARFSLSGAVYRWLGSDFPYGTLVVNVLGCIGIGLSMIIFEDRFLVDPALRIFLTIGILGGFTTFSTLSYETFELLRDAEFLLAALNITVSVSSCLLGTCIGVMAGRFF